MFTFVLVLAVVAFWFRLSRVNKALEALTLRVTGLEMRSSAFAVRAAKAETPAPQEVRPVERPAPPPTSAVIAPRQDIPRPAAVEKPAPSVPAAPVAPSAPIAPSAPVARESLESRIGSRWLLYIGVVAIVIGAAYFIKLAFDNEWITPAMRVVMGGLAGFALAYAGSRFARAGYMLYGQMLSGGGIAMLYVSTYGAFNYYHLISQPAAFALMLGVTVFGASLADRHRSQGLALMAVGGGFVTPFLLPGDSNAQVALFTYDAIIVAGTMYLAGRRDWPFLNLLSYASVGITLDTWAAAFYTPARYLPTEIFLTVFCAMFVYILRATRHSTSAMAATVRAVLWSAPVGYYVASLAVLSEHSLALLVFLLALSLVGSALAHARKSSIVRAVFWLGTVVPLGGWIYQHAGTTWLTPGLVTVVTVYALTLISQFAAVTGDDASWNDADIALLHGNALFTAFSTYVFVDAVRADLTATVVAGFAAWHGVLAIVLARRDRRVAVHAGALAFTMLAAATALQFHGAALTAAWAAEGCAIVWLGLREQRAWLRMAGALVFMVAVGRLGVLLAAPPLAGQQLLMNERTACGLFIIALTYGLAWMHHRRRAALGRTTEVAVALVGAKLLILAVACAEIGAYWTIHVATGFVRSADLVAAFTLVSAATAWMGLYRREELGRVGGGLLLLEATALLLAMQFDSVEVGYRVAVNARVAAGLLVIATLYTLARLHQRLGAHLAGLGAQVGALLIAANLLTLSLLTSEINAYFEARGSQLWASIAGSAMQAIAWTVIGAALVWLGTARREFWTRLVGTGVLIVGALLLVRLEFIPAPAGYVTVANPRLVASAIVVAAIYWLAALVGRAPDSSTGWLVRAELILAANSLTLLFVTSEITAYWHLRDLTHVGQTESQLARGAMLSLTWAAYATAAIVAGIRRRYIPIRYFAMVLFAITIGKVFLFDLSDLERVYRVVSIIGLGVMLLATSYMYQRFKQTPV